MKNKQRAGKFVLILLALTLLISFSTSFAAAASPGDVVINEIMQNPAAVSDSAGEWFELYNATGSAIDINGWTIQDNDFDSHVIDNGGPLLIPANGYLVLGNNSDTGSNGGVTVDYAYGSGWFIANGADEIVLVDDSASEIDRVEYDGGPDFPDPNGASMMLEDPALDNNVGANWCPSTTPFGDGDLGTPGAANGECPAPPDPGSGEVIVNEIMQNPAAVFDSAGEWFELYNTTGNPIDVNGWTIQDNDFDSHVINNGGPLLIPAGGYLVLGVNGDTASNGGVTLDYEYGSGWFLANGADEVVLLDDTLNVIDRVEYDGGPTFPDPNGASMSLEDPALDNTLGENWCTSTTPFGDGDLGTPGAENTCVPVGIPLTIMEIQGSGQFSAYDGEFVETTGVVTLFTANQANFWLQDPGGDGNTETSDGIFVAGGGFPDQGPRPAVGDLIRVVARVEEQQFGNALPLTRLRDVAFIEVLSSNNPLPHPIPLTDLPNISIADGIDFWEPLEGMLVSVGNAPVVGPTSQFGEFAMLAKRDAKPGSGYYPQTKQILIRSLGGEMVDYNPERILVDDSSLDEAIFVTPGDRVRSLVGAVDYTFGNYKLQPATYDVKTHQLPYPPASKRSGPLGDTVITTFNVENLFDLVNNPNKDDGSSTPSAAELETQLTKLALAIEVELELPEIIVVQEIENTAILQELGDRVNAATGTDYVATSFETSDGRGIEPGFLWDANRVSLLDAYQLSGPDVEAAFGPSSASPGREPLVGVFEIEGQEITIVGNHFKSKGGDDPLFGVNEPPIRVTEVQRKAQAQVVRDFVNTILDSDPDALVMVAGDLNDFQFSEPGEGANHPVAILEGGPGEVPLTNLLNLEKQAETYTFIFDGNSQVLDHMLVSPELLELYVGTDILHFNAGFPSNLGDDPTTTLRAADHDPLEGRFHFGGF